MRIVLAIVSFIIAALCLGYCGLFVFSMAQFLVEDGFDDWQIEIVFALIIGGVSFLIGIGFLVAGLLVLKGKPRRRQ